MIRTIRTTKILLAASLVAFMGLVFSVTAFAETTYMYVDIYGSLRTQVADTPTEAIATAQLRDPHSGVIPAENMTLAIGGGGDFGTQREYMYVDIYGSLRTTNASTPFEAIAKAELRHPNSGVIEADEMNA